MAIHVLDQDTINKIAAGEVIERPSSVVKELVENAIDANATAITVEIKDGGISFIRITDNGDGIASDEIKTAFLRHSTSKIKSVEDLMSVSSLGFRGEALSSIAAVAQIELITKTAESFSGYRYVIEGGKEISLEEVGVPDGTTFIVRNLFYNTPVRRKFLKSAMTEAGYISSLLEHLALSHPDISIRFINNNQNKLHTSGNVNLKDIIYNVYGRDITNNLIPIEAKTQDIEISGFIGKPAVCRGNRTYENYYINGRYIKSGIITKAIEQAYKGHIMPHNYPFCAIYFKINPAILDVNVHPTKMELRFSKNEFVYQFVFDSVKNALMQKELAVQINICEEPKNKETVLVKTETKACEYKQPECASPKHTVQNDTAYDDIAQNNAVYGSATQNSAAQEYKAPALKPLTSVVTDVPARLPEPFEIKRSTEMVKEDNKAMEYARSSAAEQMSFFENPLIKKENEDKYRIIGQLFDTYWLIEFDGKFYIMDQHAAHEKILFEKTMKSIREKKMDTQMIMPPVVIELNMRQEEVVKECFDSFVRVGFEMEDFGNSTYKVTGIPAGFPNIDCKQLLTDMIDGLVDDHKGDMEIITERVASMSCKAAVKGNNRLSFMEAKTLIRELMDTENPYNCPHGRPTLIVMSKYELERKFKRIV